MGLLNYYDDRNKVETELLKIWLYQKAHYGDFWKYSRVATKRYSYVGMDKDTAISCSYDKQQQYQYFQSEYDQQLSAHVRNMVQGANVAAYHDEGNMYHVDIDVNVNDEASFTYDGTPSIAYINSQFYLKDFDEDEGSNNNGVMLSGNNEIIGV